MLAPDFAQSWFNSEHTVAGRHLRCFSLWHYAYLRLIDSPFIPSEVYYTKGREGPTYADVELATRICQLRYEESLGPPKAAWVQKLRTFFILSRSTETEQIQLFYDYINDYFTPPRFNRWKEVEWKHRGGPPDALSVASACMMMFGGGPEIERYVWEMPIGKAFWYASTLHYNRGSPLDYVTAKDDAWRKMLREKKRQGLI